MAKLSSGAHADMCRRDTQEISRTSVLRYGGGAMQTCVAANIIQSKEEQIMAYVDGFVLPFAKKHLAAYKKFSSACGKIWIEHGALEYYEAVGDHLTSKLVLPFPKMAKAKAGETVIFSWILYKSRKHRDEVNKKVMADSRIMKMMTKSKLPMDMKRMAYGGFKVFVHK